MDVPYCIEKNRDSVPLKKIVFMVVRLAGEAYFPRVTGMSHRRRIDERAQNNARV